LACAFTAEELEKCKKRNGRELAILMDAAKSFIVISSGIPLRGFSPVFLCG
jgi:hypothetical protein